MATGDEGEILPGEEILWRRLYSRGEHSDVVPDEAEPGGYRVSSAAFRSDQPDGLSVHRKHLTDEATILRLHPGVGLAEISVSEIEAVGGLRVVADPIEGEETEPDDPSHALIKPRPKSSKSKNLARAARIIMLPEALAHENR